MLTNDDILHIYTPTREILEYDTETNLLINGSLFQVVDIGGQLSERKKWIHCVENITAVMFLAALSDFDQSHKMEESIALFHTIGEFFSISSLIMYLCDNEFPFSILKNLMKITLFFLLTIIYSEMVPKFSHYFISDKEGYI